MGSLLLSLGSLALLVAPAPPGDPDSDRDGLSDFHEVRKYLTDPKKADSDGDGVPDGDWDERREFTYSVRAVMHVMAPFDVAAMNDDYQDVRVLDLRPDLLEFEVVVYPFNTVADAIEPNAKWAKQPEMKEFVAPGACCNWDKEMQSQLHEELKGKGVDVASLDDVQAAKAVSQWLMERSGFEDSFTTFCVEFDGGAPKVAASQQSNVAETLEKSGRTLEQQFERELFGKGMFENKIHGSCTSSAIYLSTGLKAAGIPTRTILCTPIVDANDAREVEWITTRIEHVGVRAVLAQAAKEQHGSWTSHTFNEVFVGGRWRRLNYTNLGQNVLDKGGLGLMVHVHTFTDHSQGRLIGWGDRWNHPLHAALFGGPNPYSSVSLSDSFGPHAKIANEMLTASTPTIERLYWYDDPARDRELATDLGPPDGAGHFFAHVADDPALSASDYMEFFRSAERTFVLRARGRDDVPARIIEKYWVDTGRGLNDFILRIEPADYSRMDAGVEYALVAAETSDKPRWKVAQGVGIARSKR